MSRGPFGTARSVEADAQGEGRSARVRLSSLAMLGLLFLGFAALGAWQVERLAWKIALIARIDQRVHAPAVPAPERSTWTEASRGDWEYRHVRVTGRYLRGADTAVQAVTELGAGYWLLTPLRTTDGAVVLINRGFVAERPSPVRAAGAMDASPTGGTPETVTGLLRLTEPGGGFLRHNDAAADRWFSRDLVAIARARGVDRVAPYFIDADASNSPVAGLADAPIGGLVVKRPPVGGLTVVHFHNNHLVYAVTWFVLALMTVAAGWQLTREDRRRRRIGRTSPARAVDTAL